MTGQVELSLNLRQILKTHAMDSSCKLFTIHWSVNLVYERRNKEQLCNIILSLKLGITHETHTLHCGQGGIRARAPEPDPRSNQKSFFCQRYYGNGPHVDGACGQTIHNQKEGQVKNLSPIRTGKEGGRGRCHRYAEPETKQQQKQNMCAYLCKTLQSLSNDV